MTCFLFTFYTVKQPRWFYEPGSGCCSRSWGCTKEEPAAPAPKCSLLAFIYCLWRGSSPSWSHLAEVLKEAVDPVSIARKKKKKKQKTELVSWLPLFYFDSSALQMTPISGQQNALRDAGEFSYWHWPFRTCLLTNFKRQSQCLKTKKGPQSCHVAEHAHLTMKTFFQTSYECGIWWKT